MELTIWKKSWYSAKKTRAFWTQTFLYVLAKEWGEWDGNYSLWCINKSVGSKKDRSWPSSKDMWSKKNQPIFLLNNPLQHNKWLRYARYLVSSAQWTVTSSLLCFNWTICCVGPHSWALLSGSSTLSQRDTWESPLSRQRAGDQGWGGPAYSCSILFLWLKTENFTSSSDVKLVINLDIFFHEPELWLSECNV